MFDRCVNRRLTKCRRYSIVFPDRRMLTSMNMRITYDNFAFFFFFLLKVESHDREKRFLIAKESELQDAVQSLQKELGQYECSGWSSFTYMYTVILKEFQITFAYSSSLNEYFKKSIVFTIQF